MNKPDASELHKLQNAKIFVAGHQGMVGAAIVRRLQAAGCNNLIRRNHALLDLENQQQTLAFFEAEKPDYVFMAAAKVGGIYANDHYPAQFIYSNLMIATNVIHAAHLTGVQSMVFLGSSCIYPANASQPMSEDSLLTGKLEKTNEPYAIAKIAGIKLCESYNREYNRDYRCVMPTNLYGSHDNFDLQTSHVLAALLRKFHEAKMHAAEAVEIWGTGTPKREFLHVDDLADACLYVACIPRQQLAAQIDPRMSHVNIGTGEDVSIAELAAIIKDVVGYQGEIRYNHEYPDGVRQKLLDVSLLSKLGWRHKIKLTDGITMTYQWYLNQE